MLSTNSLFILIQNNFGNYVLQKILLLVSEPARDYLIFNIIKTLKQIGENKLIMKWKNICDFFIKTKRY